MINLGPSVWDNKPPFICQKTSSEPIDFYFISSNYFRNCLVWRYVLTIIYESLKNDGIR